MELIGFENCVILKESCLIFTGHSQCLLRTDPIKSCNNCLVNRMSVYLSITIGANQPCLMPVNIQIVGPQKTWEVITVEISHKWFRCMVPSKYTSMLFMSLCVLVSCLHLSISSAQPFFGSHHRWLRLMRVISDGTDTGQWVDTNCQRSPFSHSVFGLKRCDLSKPDAGFFSSSTAAWTFADSHWWMCLSH